MHIEHVAIWTKDLETMRDFYVKYFNMSCNDKYTNSKKGFHSYFLSWPGSRSRIELMDITGLEDVLKARGFDMGFCHICISVGSEEAVNALTERLRTDGYTIAGETRWSGDGYYESVVLDPEGNRVEITI